MYNLPRHRKRTSRDLVWPFILLVLYFLMATTTTRDIDVSGVQVRHKLE